MRFYLSTAEVWQAEQAAGLGFVEGVSLPRAEVIRTGRDYQQLYAECARMPFALIAVQAASFDAYELAQEAERIVELALRRSALVMPMTLQSVRAVSGCQRAGALAALQFIASPVQALVAARAGAAQVWLHAAQLGAAGIATAPFVEELKGLFVRAGLTTEVWVEAARDVAEVARVAMAGADGVVCEWNVMQTLAYHPLTDQGIEQLLAQWQPNG